jgi:hypothetical protein
MRFLIEIELRTVVPLVIEAGSEDDALETLRSATADELHSGDPIPQPPTVRRITALGE